MACHRLKNKKKECWSSFRTLTTERWSTRQDLTSLKSEETKQKLIIHENLTEARADMIRRLGQMKEKSMIVNYHTQNGIIYARSSRNNRYAIIEPCYTDDEITKILTDKRPISQRNKTCNYKQKVCDYKKLLQVLALSISRNLRLCDYN